MLRWKGTAERPPMPVTAAVNDVSVDVPEDSSSEINKDVNQKVKDMIEKEFPGSTLEERVIFSSALRNGSR